MANPEHLEILRQGAETWNKWRSENQNIKPDLMEAPLWKANLTKINFSQTNLCMANLALADLRSASLYYAALEGTNLVEANLSDTQLRLANLIGANLMGANLSRADLSRTNLTLANLSMANFSEALLQDTILDRTVLTGVDLSKTGLDCFHYGPCFVDLQTLLLSKGVHPGFWRNCGVQQWQIEASKLLQPSLRERDITDIGYEIIRIRGEKPIQLHSCFISYSSKDEAFAKRLHTALHKQGVSCWIAPHDMQTGARIRDTIDKEIRLHDRLLLILSENSVNSSWVENEVETALEKESKQLDRQTVLFPIRIDDAIYYTEIAWAQTIKRSRHITDFSDWKNYDRFEQSLKRIVHDLRIKNQ